MSFTRRFSSFPSSDVISQIEGVVIVDLPAPASIQGVSTGVVGVIGEFADMKWAVNVDATGTVTTNIQPQEVGSTASLISEFGGWDASLGDFGGDDGNGYMTVYGKRFSRLVLCPVNLASSKAVRLWRELPTNRSATDPSPIGYMQGASIAAGSEFQTNSAVDVVRLGTAVNFTATDAYVTGIDGQQAPGTGVSNFFTSVGSDFIAAGVKVGDALVLGVIGGAGEPGTYRIISIEDKDTLVVEKQDGTSFTWTSESALPFRIHVSDTADTGGENALADEGGFTIPVRPTKVAGSSSSNGTIAAGTVLEQPIPAADGTATAWATLSGLTMKLGASGVDFTAAVQAPNAVTGAAIEALYQNGLDAMLSDSDPIREVSIIVTSRTSETIRTALKAHVLAASAEGRGRMACMSPPVNERDTTDVLGSSYVGANRDERVIFCWPAVNQFGPTDAVGTKLKLGTGQYTVDGKLDVRSDIFMASVLSNLASERNPGQSTDPIPLCLSPILGFQTGVSAAQFSMTDYIRFRQAGVCAIRFDRAAGKVFQSGITTALPANQKNINRRRMADEIQDSIAAAYAPYVKQPLTAALKSNINGATVTYLEGLKSVNNPAAQRIEDYSVDVVSGNTPELNAQGIYVVIVKVRMLATADFIVLQAEVGPNVTVTAA